MLNLSRRALLIAKRDYIISVRSKSFLFGLIVFPVLFDGSLLGVGIGERGEQPVRSLAGGAAQDGIDETVTAAGARLGELDGVGDDGVVGRTM